MPATKSKTTVIDRQIKAIQQLGTMDHAFVTPEFARKTAAAFDMKIGMERQRANTGAFKGLTVEGAKRNALVEGYDARNLADAIASHLNLSVPSMFGRGSGLRAAVGVVLTHLEAEKQKLVGDGE